MSLADFFNGAVPQSVSSPTSSTSSLPDWYSAFLKGADAAAVGAFQTPFQPSPVPQVAPLNDLQHGSINLTGGSVSQNLPGQIFQQSAAGLQPALAGYDPNQTQNYMSPYTQNVVNDISTLGARNLNENILPAIDNSFIGSGQFGSSRNADYMERALRDEQLGVSQQQNQALQAGYTQAQNTNLANLQNQRSAAATGAYLGTGLETQQLQNEGALASAGQIQQGQDQANLNAANSQFQQQTQYPWQQLSNLSGILGGQQVGSTQTGGTQTYPNAYGASPFASLLGAGSLLSSLSTPSMLSGARGGHVKRMARGGLYTKHAIPGLPRLPRTPMSKGAVPPRAPMQQPMGPMQQMPGVQPMSSGALPSMPGTLKANKMPGLPAAIRRPGGQSNIGPAAGGVQRRASASDGLSQMLGMAPLPSLTG